MQLSFRKTWFQTKWFCKTSLRVGFFLAWRQIKRTNLWTTVLIVMIMMFTFLNLVAVNGILVGLVEGSSNAFKEQYSGDLLITKLDDKNYIQDTKNIVKTLQGQEEVIALTTRLRSGAMVQANYKSAGSKDKIDQVAVQLTGIDPFLENSVTKLESLLVEGEYLDANDYDEVLIGSAILEQYASGVPSDETIENVALGDKVRLEIQGKYKEVTIKGILKSKIQNVSRSIFMTDKKLRDILERPDANADEIALLLRKDIKPEIFKEELKSFDFYSHNLIETYQEAQGQFFEDIKGTFTVLANVVGSIGLIVASITIFIVIFINAVTRKKFIGILKGIGICSMSLKISFTLQALFYAILGNLIGLMILYGLIKPYIDRNPIDFPFSDGILVATVPETAIRVAILIIITVIAGYIPARMIVRKNTLDAILDR